MKIAILSFFSGLETRGVERWTEEIATRLAEKHEVVVFQNGPKATSRRYKIVSVGLSFKREGEGGGLSLMKRAFLDYQGRLIARFALRILPLLLKARFDIIIPTDGGWEPAFVRILSWISGSKMIIVGHAGLGWVDRNNLWCFPDTFVALSSFAQKWARKVNPFVKSVYIPDGVDTQRFKPEGEKAQLSLKRPLILCVAALIPSKRIELAIKAVAALSDFSLLVVGGGELKRQLSILGKTLLGDRFVLKEFPFNEMPKVYRAADAFTIPSISSYSFEMVLLEAMASNVSVVADKDPIREEIVGEGGFLVDPTNTKDFSKAIRKALEKRWGDVPRKQALKFRWERICSSYERLFRLLKKV